MNKALFPTLLAALALPATASAGTLGSDPATGTPGSLVNCTDGGVVKPCSITVTKLDGAPAVLPPGSTVTGWSGYFDTDSYARVRLMRNNGDGTFTSVDASASAITDGGVNAYDTSIEVPATGQHFVALDLMEGSVSAVADPDSQMFAADDDFEDGETAAAGEATAHRMQLQVTYETAGDTPLPDTGDDQGGDGDEPAFAIQPQGILGADATQVELFSRTEGDENVDVKMQLKVGKKVVASRAEDDMEYHSSDTWFLDIPAKVRKALLKKGSLKATATATVTGRDSGRKSTVRRTVKLLAGGDARYDGTYRGDGPIVLVVKRGVITAINQSMFLFCSNSGDNMTRGMEMVSDQMPALVAPNGSFAAKGSSGWDSFTYKGKLSRSGVSKGYSSLFYTQVYYGSSGITSEQCYQASNWTAKRA